jgi:hypothetical protein
MGSTLRPSRRPNLYSWATVTQALALTMILLAAVDLRGQTVTATTPAADTTSKNPGETLNKDLPRWMRLSVEVRGREEGRTSFSFVEGANDTYTLTRTRIGLDVKPAKWFHFFVQGQDSRVIDIDKSRVTASIKNTFDLRQGYVELKTGG